MGLGVAETDKGAGKAWPQCKARVRCGMAWGHGHSAAKVHHVYTVSTVF